MALIRLRGCAGWSAPELFANPRSQVFSRRGPIISKIQKLVICLVKNARVAMSSIYLISFYLFLSGYAVFRLNLKNVKVINLLQHDSRKYFRIKSAIFGKPRQKHTYIHLLLIFIFYIVCQVSIINFHIIWLVFWIFLIILDITEG